MGGEGQDWGGEGRGGEGRGGEEEERRRRGEEVQETPEDN